jgi:hypothetical protein
MRKASSQGKAALSSAEDQRIAYYQLKADECRDLASSAADPETRDEWLRLANQWTYLVLHARRDVLDPASREH